MLGSFIDDGIMCGPADQVVRANNTLDEAGEENDIQFPLAKAEAYSPSEATREWLRGPGCDGAVRLRTPEGPIPVSDAGIAVLGTPIGTDDFIMATLEAEAQVATHHLQRLSAMEHTQSEHLVLRYCSVNALGHLAKVNRPELTRPAMRRMDEATERELQRIVATELHTRAKTRAPRHRRGSPCAMV